MTHFLAKELAFKSDVSMPWQDYIPLKKINLLSEFADMNVEESEVYFIMLLLSRFSRVRLCATPEMAAHQAPPSLGFSRQEHWSGLPFPFPMYESEKWEWSRSVVSDPQQPHELQPTRLLRPWDFPGKSTGVGCHCLLQYFIILLSLIHCSRRCKESPDVFTSLVNFYHNRDMTYLAGINQSWHSKYYKQRWYFKNDIDLWMLRCHVMYTDNQ